MNARFGPFDILAFAVESRLRPGTFAIEHVFCLKFAYEAYMAEQSIFSYEN